MDQEGLMSRLLATFGGEADERVQAMNRELLMLEGTTDEDAIEQRLDALFREAHSLKGAARAVNAERVEGLSHRLETLFELLRRGDLAPEPPVCDVIYRVLDALGQLVAEATTGEAAGVDLEWLAGLLADPGGGVIEAASPASPAEPLPPPRAEPPSPPAEPPSPPAEPPPPPARAQPASAAATATDMVRIATSKLDTLLADVGELAVAQAGSLQQVAELRALAEDLQAWEAAARRQRAAHRRRGSRAGAAAPPVMSAEDWERLRSARARIVDMHRVLESSGRRVAQATAELEEEVRRSRMVPVSTALDSFPRMVRDIAREREKQVVLAVTGADTEVDRSLLEQLRSPLIHVVRNSVDHGIEQPEDRVRAGKPPHGTISVRAYQQGGTLSVEVADDGTGIDLARVRARAVERGICTTEAAGRMSDSEALGLIYRSGFSTAPMITDLSGRGVGLDVVREHVERLHGMIEVDASAGAGTRFTFVLPLSVSTTPCLLVGVSGQSFALPVTNVSRIVTVTTAELERVEGAAVVRDEQSIVALADLGDVLGIERDEARAPEPVSPAILIGSADRRMAFRVDALIDIQNVVTKGLPAPLYRVRHLSGVTILGTGDVLTVLNAANLIRTAAPRREPDAAEEFVPPRPPVVLVVEDSITTRALERNILESAGYEVRTAGDGLEAWSMLQEQNVDAVVTDVYMSGMDGFELTAKLRADARFARLPVVLVTSKDSSAHRRRGVEVGADAYIVKGSFEQRNLVDAVARLV